MQVCEHFITEKELGEGMKYKFSNLIDTEKSQRLLDSFCDAVGIAAAIIDLEGEVLVGSRWQEICTDFQRINERTCKKCIESDTQLANELQQGKHFSIYQCRNGLTDAASPIIIEGEHIANTFVGQFLLKTPDRDFFCQQAATYGFEETDYLDALSKVPIVMEEKLPAILNFLTTFTELLAIIGIDRLKQIDAAEALQESEEKYRTVLESNPDPVVVYDLEGRVTYLNPAFTRVFGWSSEEQIGKKIDNFVPEGNWPETRMMIDKITVLGENFSGLETRRYTKEGNILDISISGSCYRDQDGNVAASVINLRDITEQKRLEDQLQNAQRMESIGTLAGGIAHNFNNLLMGILGHASLMLLKTDPDHPNHKRLKNIEKQVESGSKLTSQLLGYAREGSYEVKPISLNQLVNETSDTFGMTKKEITVHQELSEKLYGIKADQGQIEQVLLNLYVNAADAMRGGGDLYLKTINVADKDMTGKPYKVKPGNYVLLTVKDTGVGMDEETKERIFEPFFTTKGLASGTGLGMASAYGIIKGHGGYIDVDSKKGEGTTFSIYLPATEKDLEEKKVSSDEFVKGKGTVLLVDDEEMILDAVEEMLKHLGYEVLLAKDGQEALGLYKKNQDKVDLVLLDMVMPIMGGGKTFDRMKEINSDVKVLLSSGYSIEGEAKEILKRGCDAFIQKPFKPEQLSQKIVEILGKK